MAGMIRALQKQDEGIVFSQGQISLISAFSIFCCMIGIIFLGMIGDKVGRRWSLILFSIPIFINWVILYYAKEFAPFMLSRFFAGVSVGPLVMLSLVAAAEYTSPNSRAIYLSMISMGTPALGTGIGHALGVVYHWRTLTIVGMVLTAVQIFLPYFWVESPHWLASKGRFEDCVNAFRKLHGNAPSTEDELQLIIKMETSKQKAANEMNIGHNFKKLLLAFKRRYFWDLMIMNTFLNIYYAAAGKVLFSNLATVVLEEVTGTPDVLLFTLLVDGFILVGTCISCILIKRMSIRVLLFSSGLTANGILIVLSACIYFKNSEVYFQWINVVLLTFYFIIIHAGPYPVMEILLGEMFPMELKLYCYVLSSPIMTAIVFLSMVLLQTLVGAMGYHGFFLLNSAIMFVCLGYLWTRLPETKGKTLQEIEVYFKTKNFDVAEVLSK